MLVPAFEAATRLVVDVIDELNSAANAWYCVEHSLPSPCSEEKLNAAAKPLFTSELAPGTASEN